MTSNAPHVLIVGAGKLTERYMDLTIANKRYRDKWTFDCPGAEEGMV
jgi:hypothetical protein